MLTIIPAKAAGLFFSLSFLILAPVSFAGMIDKTGMAPWEICGLCHNLNGISSTAKFPKLAGQKSPYIKKQFLDFHTERRTNEGGQMQAITTEVEPITIDAIANYFAELSPPPALALTEANGTADHYQRGETLFTQGRDHLPACANCHGIAAQAPDLNAPWLYAQHSDYLIKQLTDFKEGLRTNDDGQIMQHIAQQLSDDDKLALATYLTATQPRRSRD